MTSMFDLNNVIFCFKTSDLNVGGVNAHAHCE